MIVMKASKTQDRRNEVVVDLRFTGRLKLRGQGSLTIIDNACIIEITFNSLFVDNVGIVMIDEKMANITTATELDESKALINIALTKEGRRTFGV